MSSQKLIKGHFLGRIYFWYFLYNFWRTYLSKIFINQSMSMKSASGTGKLKIQRLKCKNTINAKQEGKRNGASRY